MQRIITDLNLRAPGVVFVDDNAQSLEEVASVVDGIVTFDSTKPELDELLRTAIEESKGGKSHVAKYRIMEDKHTARQELDGSNEDFLRRSDGHMIVVRTQENFLFAARLEELVNRTNKLNFLKTLFESDTLAPHIVDLCKNLVYFLFGWASSATTDWSASRTCAPIPPSCATSPFLAAS